MVVTEFPTAPLLLLLLAVKVAARAMPGSFFFRPVGESMLPVLRVLECEGKTLGWSSRMFHVVLSGEALLRLASFLRPSELLSNRAR